jgi:transposase InsO family protein
VRKANVNRQAARKLLERNRKDNLLKRKFRLHRPHEVYLSDVTYLDFGNKKRAYGSAVIDAVTGKVIDFEVSESNDLQLAYETLKFLEAGIPAKGAMFHTDQGSLYLSDSFQRRLKESGFVQSMSKRGNCWDNSPQESFFGHFKDEVNYSTCKDISEVFLQIIGYLQYYNEERCQWTRNRMTPVEYEKYLSAMDDHEFAAYLAKEEAKYRKMMKNAAEKAKARAKTIGPE